MKKFWRQFGLTALVLFMAIIIVMLVWAANPAEPEDMAMDSMNSSQDVLFEEINDWLVFRPRDAETETGFIFYPGGRVDYRAYAPLAKQIAEEGFTTIVVPMPLNFAFLGINRASEVIQTFPEIEHWAVGGHSLGGAMAAEYTKSNPSAIEGLILWAAYPGDNNDLSEADVKVASIFASNDGLATPQEITDSQQRLPSDAVYTSIPGGNHAGFGWYGTQSGDGQAEISKTSQQDQITDATVDLLESLGQ